MTSKNLPENFWEMVEQKIQQQMGMYHRPATEIIIDDVDLRELLKISRRTALNYRNSGRLKNYKIENKIFYFLSDVLDFIKNSEPGL